MRLRKRIPAALFGAALVVLLVSALGLANSPKFGGPLPGLTPAQ